MHELRFFVILRRPGGSSAPLIMHEIHLQTVYNICLFYIDYRKILHIQHMVQNVQKCVIKVKMREFKISIYHNKAIIAIVLLLNKRESEKCDILLHSKKSK